MKQTILTKEEEKLINSGMRLLSDNLLRLEFEDRGGAEKDSYNETLDRLEALQSKLIHAQILQQIKN